VIGRDRECPLFLRPGLVIRGRRIGQEGGGHLVGEMAEVVMDLHFQAGEGRRVVSESVTPLRLPGIGLAAQLRGDVIQRGDDGAGLGLRADLHGRLECAGDRKSPRLCYRGPREITTFRESTLREEYPNLDASPALETIGGHRAVGHDVEFISLDLTNTCAIRCFRTNRRTVLVFGQWSDIEDEETAAQLVAVRRSLEETDAEG
jgi:hypothetical protein